MTINCLALKSANWRTNIKKYRKFIHTTCIKIYFSNWQKQQNFLKSCDTVEHAYSSPHANQWFIIPLKEILFDVLTSATSEKMLSLAIAYWQWDNSLNFPHFHEYFLFSNHLRVIKTKLLNFFGVWKWQVTSKQVVLLWCMCISIYWWDFLPENVKESIRTEN